MKSEFSFLPLNSYTYLRAAAAGAEMFLNSLSEFIGGKYRSIVSPCCAASDNLVQVVFLGQKSRGGVDAKYLDINLVFDKAGYSFVSACNPLDGSELIYCDDGWMSDDWQEIDTPVIAQTELTEAIEILHKHFTKYLRWNIDSFDNDGYVPQPALPLLTTRKN